MVTAKIGILGAFAQCIFRGDHKMVTFRGNELSNKFLTGPVGVVVCRVNIIPACIHICIENLAAFIFRRAPAPIIAECHRTKAQFGNTQATAS